MLRATFAGFSAALSAMQANSKKLDVTSQNLANMNVEGYTRQELKVSGLNYENPTSFYMNENDVNVGFGVSLDEVTQIRDQFLDKQFRYQNAEASYSQGIDTALTSLSSFLDESNLDGLRKAFDDVQTALTSMQDPSKVNDPVYEGELRSRMAAVTNLFNSSARQIEAQEANEFHRIDGSGTSENGAVQNINQLLEDIASLNAKIKENQLLGNGVLELKDQRNQKLDELSSLIPIQVSTFTEKQITYYDADQITDAARDTDPLRYVIKDGKIIGEIKDKGLRYDLSGNVTGKSSYPEDLRVSLLYQDENGTTHSVVLVNGAIPDENGKSYGSVSLKNGSELSPLDTALHFTGAGSYTPSDTGYESSSMDTDNVSARFRSGSLQSSLDLLTSSKNLSQDGEDLLKSGTYYGYDYYMDRLDLLAKSFADRMNLLNFMGNAAVIDASGQESLYSEAAAKAAYTQNPTDSASPNGSSYLLLVNRGTDAPDKAQTAEAVTARNISIAKNWVNGKTHIGLKGDSATDTVLNMLQSMTDPQSMLENKSFSDYMNNISTTLANEGNSNKNALTTHSAVLSSIQKSRDQLSGVSMDEEAANMMNYVSSYNAAARLMTALDETLQTLLNIAR